MRSMAKKLACVLAVVLLLTTVPAQAASTVRSGSRTYRLVSVPLDGSCTGQVVTAGGTVHTDQSAASLIQSAVAGTGGTVVAAVNGMFFNSYYNASKGLSFPGNVPLILTNLVQDGKAVSGGGEQNSIGFTKDGGAKIDRVKMTAQAMVNGHGPVLIWDVNHNNNAAGAVLLITDAVTMAYTPPAGSTAVVVQDGAAQKIITSGSVTLTKGQSLLVFNRDAAASHAGWKLLPAVGDSVTFSTKLESQDGDSWDNMTSIAGGGALSVKSDNGVPPFDRRYVLFCREVRL